MDAKRKMVHDEKLYLVVLLWINFLESLELSSEFVSDAVIIDSSCDIKVKIIAFSLTFTVHLIKKS